MSRQRINVHFKRVCETVGIGHGRQVGLGLDPQVERPEPPGRDVVGGVCEDMREAQVVVVADHPRNGTAWDISAASRPFPGRAILET